MPVIAIYPTFNATTLTGAFPTSTAAIANTISIDIAVLPIPTAQAVNIAVPDASNPQENTAALLAPFLSGPQDVTVTIPCSVCHSAFNECYTKVTVNPESTHEEKQPASQSLHQCHQDFRSAGLGPRSELNQSTLPSPGEEHTQRKCITGSSMDSVPARQLEQPRRNRTVVASTVWSLSRVPHMPMLPRSEEELAGSKDEVPILPRSEERPAGPKADKSDAFPATVGKPIILPREETEGGIGEKDPEAASLHLAGSPELPEGFQSRKGATGATRLPDNGYYPYSHCPPACGSRTIEKQHGETHEECYCLWEIVVGPG